MNAFRAIMPRKSRRFGTMLSLVGSLCISGGLSTSTGADIDPARLRDEWKLLAESLETMTFTSVDSVKDLESRRSREEHHRFSWTRGGRAALSVDIIDSDGRRRARDLREDGRFHYQLTHLRQYPDDLSTLRITRQSSTGTRYDGTMPRGLWPVFPFGKTYHQILIDGGTLRPSDHDSHTLTLVARDGETVLEADLTRNDGVPEELRLSSDQGTMSIRITKSEVIHDRWFPVAGEGEEREFAKDGSLLWDRRFRYELKDIALNQFIPATRFAEPTMSPGVIVFDRVKGKTWVVGGREARIAWEARHPLPEDNDVVTRPIVAGPKSRYASPTIGFALVSVVLGLLALYVRFRPDAK